MELRVFDKTAQPLGAIDELPSLLWHTKYFDVGTFSLLAPITDNNSRLLVEGNLITKHDGKKEVKTADGGVWRRAAQITYVHITKDENGLEQLEAQGYMLSWWLNKRCIYPQIMATGTNQYLINLMVKNNCGNAAGTKRRFPLFTFLAQETIDGVAVEYANEVYAQLGQEVKARAQAGKLGYDILLNEREGLFGFYLYKGNDLTATNTEGNTPCIFSKDFDNVNEQEYTASIENCGNFIYVQGAADDDGSQPVTTVDGEGATGLDLVEVFCDATDIARKYQQGETEVTIPLPQAERNRRYAGRTDRRGKDQKIAGYGAAAYLQPLAALIAGGNWNNGANCGARAVNCNNYPWNVNTNIGARGACDLVRTLQAQSSTEYWQGLRKG